MIAHQQLPAPAAAHINQQYQIVYKVLSNASEGQQQLQMYVMMALNSSCGSN
jgi:hypothetical protein